MSETPALDKLPPLERERISYFADKATNAAFAAMHEKAGWCGDVASGAFEAAQPAIADVMAEALSSALAALSPAPADLVAKLLSYRDRLVVTGEHLVNAAATNPDSEAARAYAAVLFVQSSLRLDAEKLTAQPRSPEQAVAEVERLKHEVDRTNQQRYDLYFEVERLREALRPFAEYARAIDDGLATRGIPDGAPVTYNPDRSYGSALNVSDLRKARAALAASSEPGKMAATSLNAARLIGYEQGLDMALLRVGEQRCERGTSWDAALVAAMEAIRKEKAEPGAGGEWQWMPKVPSGEQQAAGRDVIQSYLPGGRVAKPVSDQWQIAREVYAVMLAAAQPPPQEMKKAAPIPEDERGQRDRD